MERRLVARLTQGTMALEAQGVSSEVLSDLEESTMQQLLAGPGKKLWSDQQCQIGIDSGRDTHSSE